MANPPPPPPRRRARSAGLGAGGTSCTASAHSRLAPGLASPRRSGQSSARAGGGSTSASTPCSARLASPRRSSPSRQSGRRRTLMRPRRSSSTTWRARTTTCAHGSATPPRLRSCSSPSCPPRRWPPRTTSGARTWPSWTTSPRSSRRPSPATWTTRARSGWDGCWPTGPLESWGCPRPWRPRARRPGGRPSCARSAWWRCLGGSRGRCSTPSRPRRGPRGG
mmetsp:Transcript_71445/g.225634  ORF Transcript_71445/g.225634 Transcript_71445/m.225634 type:complete len:222 (-) Transcript_71445:317-982(-)